MTTLELADQKPADNNTMASASADAFVRQRSNTAILAFLAVVALMVTVFKFPPLLDYPNHYARMWLIAGGIEKPPFSQIYALDWHSSFTNLGIDLLARYLGPILGVSLLARSLLFLAIVLPPLGAIALHRKLFDGAYYWQIAMLYLAWCATLIGGFMNFQIGLGMALLFATIDLRLQEQNRVALVGWRLVASLLLTIMHLFSFGFYLALICGLEFSQSLNLNRPFPAWRQLLARLAIALLTCAVIPALLFWRSPVLPADALGLRSMWNDNLLLQVLNLLSAVWTYFALVDMLFLIPIVMVCTNAIGTRRFQIHGGLAITAFCLLIIACVCPRSMMGTGWISWRFPIMAALTMMVMICPLPHLPRREAFLLALALSFAVFGRTAWIGYNWWQGATDAADVEAVLADATPGSAILPLGNMALADPLGKWQRHFAWGEDTFRHLSTLAIPVAHAFVPTVFSARGKQPLVVLPPWSDIAIPEGNLHSPGVLSCPEWLARDTLTAPFLRGWRQHFDFLLILNTGEQDQYVGDALPGGLQLISERPFARLYRIDKSFVAAENTVSKVNCPVPLPVLQ